VFHSRLAPGGADDFEPVAPVGRERRRVVGADEGEELLVSLETRGLERRAEQSPGDALTTVRKRNEGSYDADVVEGVGVVGER